MTGGRVAFYRRDGDRFIPNPLGTSPWNPAAQMGVATGALVTHLIGNLADPVPMTTARLTIDILGAVPFEPLAGAARVVREGRRMRLLEGELSAGGRVVVRATALRVREAETPPRERPTTRTVPTDLPASERWMDMVRLSGSAREPGAAAAWFRVNCDVVEGVPLRGVEAVVMVADCGAGTGPMLPVADWTLANLDIAISMTRAPRGEWLLMETDSESAGNGVVVASTRLGDRDGTMAIVSQTVFPDRR